MIFNFENSARVILVKKYVHNNWFSIYPFKFVKTYVYDRHNGIAGYKMGNDKICF